MTIKIIIEKGILLSIEKSKSIGSLETFIVKCTFNNIDYFICGLYHPSKPLNSESRLNKSDDLSF